MMSKQKPIDVGPGKTGAKSISWSSESIRAKVRAAMIELNTDDDAELASFLLPDMLASHEFATAALIYLVKNVKLALSKAERTLAKPSKEVRKALQIEIDKKARARLSKAAPIILLDLPIGGKPLRNCTGAEVKKHIEETNKQNTWLGKMLELVPPSRKVGDCISESKAQKLWASLP